MSNKFRYLLFPENIYVINLEGPDGEELSVEILGIDILSRIQRDYSLQNNAEKLDKSDDR